MSASSAFSSRSSETAPATESNSFLEQLAAYRRQIDILDDRIIALLKERCHLVESVGRLKTDLLQPRCYIRPAREASMVRRVAGEFEDHPLAGTAVAAMWRLLISASTSLEQPLRISAFSPPEDGCLYWLAREYFGAFTPIAKEVAASRVVGQVVDGKALVGILPTFEKTPDDHWWQHLLKSPGMAPRIFACVPFILPQASLQGRPAEIDGLAIGFVEPEPTGEDITYLVIEVPHDTSQSKVAAACQRLGMPARMLQVVPLPAQDSRQHLMEIEGFYTEQDERLQRLAGECGDGVRLHLLGAHAKPLVA